MPYPTATAFRRALEDRLNRRARMTGEATMRLRKNVVFQRLLARLLTISPDLWVLMATGYGQAQAFLDPILSGAASEATHWEAVSQSWVSSEHGRHA